MLTDGFINDSYSQDQYSKNPRYSRPGGGGVVAGVRRETSIVSIHVNLQGPKYVVGREYLETRFAHIAGQMKLSCSCQC